MSDNITYKLDSGVALITLDDGKANAVSDRFITDLNEALDQAEADQAVVVLAGREGKFCAGFDLNVMQQGGDAALNLLQNGVRLACRLLQFPTPVVVACTGHSLAMGAIFLLSADYRVGAVGKFKVGLNEVAIKMTMPYFGVEIAKARLSTNYQIPAVACGVLYAPEQAILAGFLDEAVEADKVVPHALGLAKQLTQIDMKAHHETKLRMRENLLNDVEGLILKG